MTMPMKKIKIVAMSNPVSVGQMVLESLQAGTPSVAEEQEVLFSPALESVPTSETPAPQPQAPAQQYVPVFESAMAKTESVAGLTQSQDVTQHVWLRGNLASENGKYFPQITMHTASGAAMLEAAITHLRAAGFSEAEWFVVRERDHFCLRKNAYYTSVWKGFVALSGLVWEACHRTGMQYGDLSA